MHNPVGPSVVGDTVGNGHFANNNNNNDELSIVISLSDEKRGGLARLLTALADNDIDLLLIETRRTRIDKATHRAVYEFLITVDTLDADRVRAAIGDRCRYFAVVAAATDANKHSNCGHDEIESSQPSAPVPWFPRTVADLEPGSRSIFSFGVELNADHPGFKDEEYRKRR